MLVPKCVNVSRKIYLDFGKELNKVRDEYLNDIKNLTAEISYYRKTLLESESELKIEQQTNFRLRLGETRLYSIPDDIPRLLEQIFPMLECYIGYKVDEME